MSDQACPSTDQLKAYLLGHLKVEQIEQVASHVDRCPPCEDTVAALELQSDTVLSGLRAQKRSKHSGDDDYQQALAFVKNIGRGASAASGTGATAEEAAPPIGNLREYELLEKVGEGGMGAVYRARHTKLDKVVAIKILPAERMKDTGAVDRFEREMRAVGKLDHPNIVRAMDAGEVDGTHFLVMEYVKGIDLAKLVKRHGPLRIADACELIRQAAVGLDDAHANDMVHRDIKPSNLMLAEQRRKPPVVKVLDMGLALLGEAHSPDAGGLTRSDQIMGTLDYMAPEQGGDSHEVDIRADIYAPGATLYRLLTGQVIYHGPSYQTPVQKLMALATEPARSIQDRREGIPDELADVVHQMLAKDPDARIATPADVAEALAPFCEGADLQTLVVQTPAVAPSTEPADSVLDLSSPSSSTTGVRGDADEHDTAPPVRQPAPDAPIVARSVSEEATPTPSATPHRTPPHWRRPALIASALGSLALVAALIFYIQTGKGTLKIVIHDPEINVVITSTGAIIKAGDDKNEIRLTAGEHQLKIQRGDFEFFTDKFELKRGEKTVVEIVLVEGKITVSQDGESLALADSADGRVVEAVRDEASPKIVPAVPKKETGSDYDHLATGKWIDVFKVDPPKTDGTKIKFTDGVLELNDCKIDLSRFSGRNIIVRAQVKRLFGQNLMLSFSVPDREDDKRDRYGAWMGDPSSAGIGRVANGRWQDLKNL